MLLGIPIALGSWWGLLVLVSMMPALIWRLFDEEKFLAGNSAFLMHQLPGLDNAKFPPLDSKVFSAKVNDMLAANVR